MVAVLLVEDYGVSQDEDLMRRIAIENYRYLAGETEQVAHGVFVDRGHKYYGALFQLGALMAERALGLEASETGRPLRGIYLLRHLMTHMSFVLGALFCGFLAFRLTRRWWLGLLAMLLFLLHPRLYAHSFFNSKDIPFLAVFALALLLTHRAFVRNTLGAFVLSGVAVGIATGLRVTGLMLLAAVPMMRALDLWFAGSAKEKQSALWTASAFCVATIGAWYATMPALWSNPLEVVDLVKSSRKYDAFSALFGGDLIHVDTWPIHYVPTWFAITCPPAALLLGTIGALGALRTGCLRPKEALRLGDVRFRLLLVGCLVVPVVATIAMRSTLYDGWRHFQFLWAPFCVLAALGAQWVAGRRRVQQAAAYGATVAGLTATGTAMADLHPHQQVYFNFLVDRATPERLGQQYEIVYWGATYRQGLEWLRERYPARTLRVGDGGRRNAGRNLRILPAADRRKLAYSKLGADAYLAEARDYFRLAAIPQEPVLHRIRAYNSTLLVVTSPMLGGGIPQDVIDARREGFRDASEGRLVAADYFTIRVADNRRLLRYARTGCSEADAAVRFFLHVFPDDVADLPRRARIHEFDNHDFAIRRFGGPVDGNCYAAVPLPDYPIARIRTGQFLGGVDRLWTAEFALPGVRAARDARNAGE